MKLLLIPLGVTIALVSAGTAHAIPAGAYQGGAVDAPGSFITFDIEKSESGKRKVKRMRIDALPYVCESHPPGTSVLMRVKGSFIVKARRFRGTREAVPVDEADPTAKLTGRLKPGGKVRGTIRLRGELAGAGSKCHTGKLVWKGQKVF